MKNIFSIRIISALVFVFLLLTNCTYKTKKEIQNTSVQNYINTAAKAPDPTKDEGKICGGNKNTPCTLPLFCVFDKDSSTGTGTCQNLIIDQDLDCNEALFKQEKEIKKPVCAIIKDQKYTFLNKCEAQRRGGKIVADDFCKKTNSASNDCQAKAIGIGMCFSTTEAWEFDGNDCVRRFISGCNHEIPFETKTQCEQKCN